MEIESKVRITTAIWKSEMFGMMGSYKYISIPHSSPGNGVFSKRQRPNVLCSDCKNLVGSSTISYRTPFAFGFMRFFCFKQLEKCLKGKKCTRCSWPLDLVCQRWPRDDSTGIFYLTEVDYWFTWSFKCWMSVRWLGPKREIGAFWSILRCQRKQILYSPVGPAVLQPPG